MAHRTEEERLDALRRLNLLDTAPSEAFDRITRMASQIFALPIAAVSLTDHDRQWFKSRIGVEQASSIPRDRAPCAQVTASNALLVIPDLLADSYYRDSPLAQSGVRFYAGAPLTTRDGFGLGAMCVCGREPREASESELASLTDLAAMAMAQIELQHAFGRVDPISRLPNIVQFIEDLDDLAKDGSGLRRFVVMVDLASSEQVGNVARVMGTDYLYGMIDEAVRALRGAVGPTRKVYHVALTQFALLSQPGIEEQGYLSFLSRMLQEIRADAISRFVTTTTIGVVPFAPGETAPRDVLRTAYNAAQDARGTETRVSLYSPDRDAAHQRRFALLDAFGAALEDPQQLRLVYQPRIDLASGACVGAEALLRWRHPTLGEVSPGEFMPIVERTAMAKAATAWVLDAALSQLSAWRRAGLVLQMSVNVSASNLLEPDFADRVALGLIRHALSAGCLELEMTESAAMEDAGQALTVLDAVSHAGTRLAIDDFGTGYSSFAYLQRLPAHVVKIDQSFVRGLAIDERKRALISTMASLARDLGYRVVAEGVETREVLDCLEGTGCDEGQGYYFGRPMSPDGFATWRREWIGPRRTPIDAWAPTGASGRHSVKRARPRVRSNVGKTAPPVMAIDQ